MRTRSSISTARSQASLRDTFQWMRTASAICSPTVNTGLSEVIGSWKIMAMASPRRRCISRSDSSSRLRPWNSTSPPARMPGGQGTKPITDRAVTDLPQPDSPTSERVSPGWMATSTPSTARAMPVSMRKKVRRPRISSSGPLMPAPASADRARRAARRPAG